MTLNRLCGSGLDAVAMAARAIRGGEADLVIAGGSREHEPRAVRHAQGDSAFDRNAEIYDTTIGWRFVNPKMRDAYGDDTMPRPPRTSPTSSRSSREDQDAFALRSQQKTAAAQANGRLAAEIVAVEIPQRKGDPVVVDSDEHPRPTNLEALAKLKPDRPQGRHGHRRQRVGRQRRRRRADRRLGGSGQAPRPDARAPASSAAPSPACRRASWASARRPRREKLLKRLGLAIADIDVIELNEAFAAQGLAVLRQLGLPDDAPHVNPNGGAIALGHPLGMSGARLALTATEEIAAHRRPLRARHHVHRRRPGDRAGAGAGVNFFLIEPNHMDQGELPNADNDRSLACLNCSSTSRAGA